MKNLMRRLLSKVADSSQYYLLRSNSSRGTTTTKPSKTGFAVVPLGHVPVYVGDESERFVVSAELLNHPIFVMLLNKSAQEYGYGQGCVRIPCHVFVFERVLEGIRIGSEECDLHDMFN